MSKKIYGIISIIISIILIFLLQKQVYASSATMSASAEKVETGKTVTITANIDSAATWELDISSTGGTLQKNNNRVGNTESGYNENKTVTLGTFSADTAGSYKITLSGYVVDGDGDVPTRVNVSGEVTIVVEAPVPQQPDTSTGASNSSDSTTGTSATTTPVAKSSEAKLKNLGIRPNDFSGFSKNPNKENWSVEVPNSVSEVEVYAEAKDSKAKVTGTGKVSLKEGNNTAKVTVTAEDGTTKKTYTIKVTRKVAETTTEIDGEKTTAFGLKTLSINGLMLSPSFETETYEYTADLTEDLRSLEITAKANNENATVEIVGNENLKDGENTITILVIKEAEEDEQEGKTATYQIIVNKNVQQQIQTSWLKPSTWGKEEKIKLAIIIVLILLIISAVILKMSKETKSEKKLDFPGADELDKAIAEHQELTGDEISSYDNVADVVQTQEVKKTSSIFDEEIETNYILDNGNDRVNQVENITEIEDTAKSEMSTDYIENATKSEMSTNYIEDTAKTEMSANYIEDIAKNRFGEINIGQEEVKKAPRRRGKHF